MEDEEAAAARRFAWFVFGTFAIVAIITWITRNV